MGLSSRGSWAAPQASLLLPPPDTRPTPLASKPFPRAQPGSDVPARREWARECLRGWRGWLGCEPVCHGGRSVSPVRLLLLRGLQRRHSGSIFLQDAVGQLLLGVLAEGLRWGHSAIPRAPDSPPSSGDWDERGRAGSSLTRQVCACRGKCRLRCHVQRGNGHHVH